MISFTSYVSIIGIALGAFALTITLSVLNGFEAEIRSRVIGLEAHLRITGKEVSHQTVVTLEKHLDQDELKRLSPFITHKAVLSFYGTESAARIKGVDSLTMESLFNRTGAIIKGNSTFHSPLTDLPGILIGYRMADMLGLYISDTVNVINPLDIGGTYHIPYVGKFILTGVFKLDLFDYDDNMAFIQLSQAQRIFEFQSDHYSGIDLTFQEYRSRHNYKAEIAQLLGDEYQVNSWEDLHKSLFGAMKLEKYGSFIALCFIILVAIFNLTSSLVMMVMEKIQEIGMLQALGLNQKHLKSIFLRLGILTGCLGLLVGLTLSIILCVLQQKYQFIPLPSVYFIPYLPVEIHVLDVFFIALAGIFLIYLGTYYPSWRVSKLVPVEAIQYEK